jgi:uncharacterized protein DUF1573
VRAVLLLGLLLQAAASPETSPAPGPRIVVEPTRFELGRVLTQRTLTRTVQVRNVGQADLVIDRVASTCDCTVAKGYESSLKPGQSTSLTVTLDTREHVGPVTRTLAIHSNDPSRRVVEVTVEATVVAGPPPVRR